MKLCLVLFIAFLATSLSAEPISIKILTPIQKKKPAQIIPIQYEMAPQLGQAHKPLGKEPLTYWESPFPGIFSITLKAGPAKKIFQQESGSLFEETEVVLTDGKRKRVYQRVVYGGPDVVSGQSQSLHPATRSELGQYFSENFRSGKSVEDYARAVFILQTLDDKQVKFEATCRFVKVNQRDVLDKVQMKREVFELLISGACP